MRASRRALLRVVTALALTLAAPVAAGCGGSDDDDAPPVPRTSPAERSAVTSLAGAQRAADAAPRDPTALAELIRAHVRLAFARGNVTGNTIGAAGEAELRKAAEVWSRYLALDPSPPDVQVATLMARAFDQSGLNDARGEIRALKIAAEHTKPASASRYGQLALAYYGERRYREGDLATRRALELSPPNQRGDLRRTLRQIRSRAKTQGP